MERAERERPRMDPANVLWFFGAFALGFAVYDLLEAVSDSQDGLWILLVALAFLAWFASASWILLRSRWFVPGGLAAALAVAVFPAVAIGFLTLVDVWPSNSVTGPFDEFSGWTFAVGVATAAVGLLAWWFSRFSFVLAVAIAAVLVSAQLLTPSFGGSPSGDARATTALVIGAVLVVVGVFVDAFGRRREAFWFEVLGLFSLGAGLVWLATVDGNPDRGWIPILIAGVFLSIAAGPVRRASWAVYGVLGVYASAVRYLSRGLDETGWVFPLLLIVLALLIIALGMAEHRYGRPWAQRFVRRPPPELSP
jgi:hypothetical protein